MTYDLAQLARQNGLRKNRVLRPIEITDTLKRDLYRITVKPVRAWQAQVSERILPAYERAISTLTRDDESDDLADIIRISEAMVEGATVTVSADVERWLTESLRWHQDKWVSSVASATGMDVFPFINRETSLPKVKAYLNQITGLIKDIDATARKDVASTIWRGFTSQTPRREIGKELSERLGIARKRANLIAVDQAQKLNGTLTEIRMEEAGLTSYQWRHSAKARFRPLHKARDGQNFKIGEPAGDRPGQAIYCGCVSMPIVDVEDV